MRPGPTTLGPEMRPEEQALLLDMLGSISPGARCLEVGTAAGGTLVRMLASRDARDGTKFVVVDPMKYFPGQLETVRRNLSDHGLDPARVEFRVQTSAAALRAARRRGETFRFMVIDGVHKIMGVTGDLRWLWLLEPGGVACFHDYWRRQAGVYLPVTRFLKRRDNYEHIALAGSLLALRKARASPRPEVGLSDWAYACLWYLPLQIQRKLAKLSARMRRAPLP
jgi:predicted O-methyltransferase YrrM